MLSVNGDTIRLFLHILAATVWVGGQLTLAGLVPGLRGIAADAPRTVARRFNRIAWPAFAVLVITGIWNLAAVHLSQRSNAYQVTVMVKLVIVAASGIGAALHTAATSKRGLAIWGAVSGLTALAALFFGVMLVRGG
jgi:putative copper export protein